MWGGAGGGIEGRLREGRKGECIGDTKTKGPRGRNTRSMRTFMKRMNAGRNERMGSMERKERFLTDHRKTRKRQTRRKLARKSDGLRNPKEWRRGI